MNCQKYPSLMTESFFNDSPWTTQPPPASLILNWVQVIYQPDCRPEELDFDQAWSAAPYASALRLA